MTPYGFRIKGDARGERRLVDWRLAFASYASCDPKADPRSEAYLSAFTYGDEFREHLTANGTTKGYSGPCGGDWVWFDIDRETNLDAATGDARRLCAGLVDAYGIDGDELLIFFSGSKGFHAGLPTAVFSVPEPSLMFHRIARQFAESIAERLQVTIDRGVYDRVRIFRAPNSRHAKTGLYKRRLSFEELLHLRADRIVALAENPEPFDIPEPPLTRPQAVFDWSEVSKAVHRQQTAVRERREASGGATLNRLTLEFIRDGALPGGTGNDAAQGVGRHRLLFSAAANLAEFGCGFDLAYALLSEAALDSGLPPSEVRRQIECGLQAESARGAA